MQFLYIGVVWKILSEKKVLMQKKKVWEHCLGKNIHSCVLIPTKISKDTKEQSPGQSSSDYMGEKP